MLSLDDWRSPTKAIVKTTLSKPNTTNGTTVIDIPFFSIDYVRSDKIYAIDFDIDPGLRSCGLEEIVRPKDFARLYRTAEKHFGEKNAARVPLCDPTDAWCVG